MHDSKTPRSNKQNCVGSEMQSRYFGKNTQEVPVGPVWRMGLVCQCMITCHWFEGSWQWTDDAIVFRWKTMNCGWLSTLHEMEQQWTYAAKRNNHGHSGGGMNGETGEDCMHLHSSGDKVPTGTLLKSGWNDVPCYADYDFYSSNEHAMCWNK